MDPELRESAHTSSQQPERLAGFAPVVTQFRGRPVSYVGPGELITTAQPRAIKTILGSCVAVCLWDHQRRVGGMAHYLLPHLYEGKEPAPRYGDVAIAALLERLYVLGTDAPSLVAKIFGGASVIQNAISDVGERNIVVARELLEHFGIPLMGEDVGGLRGRKLVFCTDDGSAWVQFL